MLLYYGCAPTILASFGEAVAVYFAVRPDKKATKARSGISPGWTRSGARHHGRAPERVHDTRHPEAAGALIFPTRTDTTKTYQ